MLKDESANPTYLTHEEVTINVRTNSILVYRCPLVKNCYNSECYFKCSDGVFPKWNYETSDFDFIKLNCLDFKHES